MRFAAQSRAVSTRVLARTAACPTPGISATSTRRGGRWPGEVRLEQINPHAPGAEILPTPEGREESAGAEGHGCSSRRRRQQPQHATTADRPPAAEESALPGRRSDSSAGRDVGPKTRRKDPSKPKATKPSTGDELPGLPPEPSPTKPPTSSRQPADVTPPAKTPSKPAVENAQKDLAVGRRRNPTEGRRAR